MTEFHRRASLAASRTVAGPTEFVYVNDGSPDRSLERVLDLRREDSRIVVVDLARNFGHHPALLTGLAQASGDLVFLIDSDLEEPPELLDALRRALRDHPGADAAYGVQERRKGGWWERATGNLWYGLFRRLADVPYPADSLTARLMTRRYVDAVLLHGERGLDLWSVFALAGFEQVAVSAAKGSKGATSYTFGKRLGVALTGLTALSTVPLLLIPAAGCALLLLGLAAGAAWLLSAWTNGADVGLSGLVLWSIWLVGGLLLTALGVLALYAGAILREVKARPRAIVRRVYGPKES